MRVLAFLGLICSYVIWVAEVPRYENSGLVQLEQGLPNCRQGNVRRAVESPPERNREVVSRCSACRVPAAAEGDPDRVFD